MSDGVVDDAVPSGAFRWRVGARRLDDDDWFDWGDDGAAQVARKREILRRHHRTAFAAIPGIEDESEELLGLVLGHLRRRPSTSASGGWADDGPLHPLDAAGRLVPDDLVIMVERDAGLIVGGGSVCFPNRWDLRSKLGRSMLEVHEPVARLNDELGDTIDSLLARLDPARPLWRTGWTVIDTDELYQAVDGTALPGAGPDVAPASCYVRVERETLRRLPRTRAVVFAIRTYVRPLPEIARSPGLAARIAEQLSTMPADVLAYKELSEIGARVVDHLRRPA